MGAGVTPKRRKVPFWGHEKVLELPAVMATHTLHTGGNASEWLICVMGLHMISCHFSNFI